MADRRKEQNILVGRSVTTNIITPPPPLAVGHEEHDSSPCSASPLIPHSRGAGRPLDIASTLFVVVDGLTNWAFFQ